MSKRIDLNADLGEGCAFDAELMTVITSCNIACGGHAGDDETMRTSLQLAAQHGVAAGAHPSFPDRENFGRATSSLHGKALERALTDQVTDLKDHAKAAGVTLAHLKPHGALYNMAARDTALAESIVTVLVDTLPGARLMGPPASQLQAVADAQGVAFVPEGFADRAYEMDGRLRDRKAIGAVLHDVDDQVAQALEIALQHQVTSYAGDAIDLPVATLCVHGDTPGAFAAAQAIRAALMAEGVSVCAPD
jgi:UPF0271 protein